MKPAVTYEAVVDGKSVRFVLQENSFSSDSDGGKLDAEIAAEEIEPGHYSILLNGRSYDVIVVNSNQERSVWVNGRWFTVDIVDPRSMGAKRGSAAASGRHVIKSPMPGRIVRILVRAGQAVEAGHDLIVVEAMKMQNVMKAPAAGRVTEVKVQPGATVNGGEALIVIEPPTDAAK